MKIVNSFNYRTAWSAQSQTQPNTKYNILLSWLTIGFLLFGSRLKAQEAGADSISQTVKALTTAIGELNTDSSIENRIRVATWQVLLGEVASERGADASLWSLASDQFAQGLADLHEIEKEISTSPDLKQRVSETPLIAMRLDAANVRRGAIEQREQLARNEERQRLNQLRTIAKSYRDLLAKMAEADFYYRLEDFTSVRRANLEVLEGIRKIYDVAGSRKDYYLLDDEPLLDASPDLVLTKTVALPLNIDFVAQVKALQAFAICRLALVGDKVNRELLNESVSWANASLTGSKVDNQTLPEGHAAENAIGNFVLGLASESLGVENTRTNPASADVHREAAPFFLEAGKRYQLALTAISEKYADSVALGKLTSEMNQRMDSLKNLPSVLLSAETQTIAGRPQAAWSTLQAATYRHHDSKLWLAMLDAGRRGTVRSADLQQASLDAERSELIPETDCRSQTVLMKLATDAIWNEMGKNGIAKLTIERRKQLQQLLEKRSSLLRKSLALEKDDVVLAEGQAFLSLAIVYETMLSASVEKSHDSLREVHRLSRDAMTTLESAINKVNNQSDIISYREALIASRLAYGHLSIRVLPDYRDDGLLAFAAALDEMGKLPFRQSDLAILGSPMLNTLATRSGESGTKLALEERQYRELVTRFLEGMFTLKFGDANIAADQMATALKLGQKRVGDSGEIGLIDAGDRLMQTDGFDDQVTLQDSVKSFKAIADIEAGRPELALVECIRLIIPSASIAKADDLHQFEIDSAIDNVQSPLVGYALASALERYAITQQTKQPTRQEMLLKSASNAFAKLAQQLRTLRMQDRYPNLVALVNEANGRLESPDIYKNEAVKLRNRGDFDGSISKLESGIERHPNSEALWSLLLESQLEQVLRGDAPQNTLSQLLSRVGEASKQKRISPFKQSYYSGLLFDKMGRTKESLAAFESMLTTADRPQDRVRAKAKISELRIRLANLDK
jgi:hypothetical protein